MTHHPRRVAVALAGVMLTTLLASPITAVPALAKKPDPAVCSPGMGPTLWKDQYHPPPTIRVRRSYGPAKGHVQTVPFWDYVAVVMRAEYSGGWTKPPLWMRIGSVTVRQYAWYHALHWRGGKVTTTVDNGDGTTTTTVECYDVKDTTADQIYKPQETGPDGKVYKGNTPTLRIYTAMRETWHITLRKWRAKKYKTALFLSGYRSGKKKPCGKDKKRYLMKQASLRDCTVKNLTFEEVLRAYYEPVYEVDVRADGSLEDGAWMGDLGVLRAATEGGTQWRLYGGKGDGFASAKVGRFGSVDFSDIVDYGRGNVDAVEESGADDERLLADLLLLTDTKKLLVARATGDGFGAPQTISLTGGQPARLLVADFDGDLIADAGLLRSSAGSATLSVMLSLGNATFAAEQAWWTGALDIDTASLISAADVNGDGKADLLVRDASGSYSTALSRASCSDLSAVGECPAAAIGAAGLGPLGVALAAPSGWSNVKQTIGDYDRDGRDDVIALVRQDNGGIKVMGMGARPDGTLNAPELLLGGSALDGIKFDETVPHALNVDFDGLADLALVQKSGSGSKLTWLRSVEKNKTSGATMVAAGSLTDSGLGWSGALRLY